jgi:ammonium transporter, Amt family
MIVYLGSSDGKTPGFSAAGWFYGNFRQLYVQAGAALTVIVYTAVGTYVILRVLKLFVSLRLPDDQLEIGDVAVHEEEVMPDEALLTRIGSGQREKASPPGEVGTTKDKPLTTAQEE